MTTHQNVCACCGQTIRKPRATVTAVVDRAQMSDAELFAHLKRIGVREDVRFFLNHSPDMPAMDRVETEALLAELETRAAKPADVKALNTLKDRVRTVRPLPVYPCGDQSHRHSISLNAERCAELQAHEAACAA